MMVKFHGGSPTSADYLLADRGSSGEARDQVEVLRGDPEAVQAVADGLDFEHKYTAGVIAWGPEDRPTREQIGEVLDEFEKTAWAGLERDRYAWTAVGHRHGDQTHVHMLAARVDLETGKSLNIAPPGWRKTFDPLRDWQNHKHGWTRPDDLERKRTLGRGHRAYHDAARGRIGDRSKDTRQEITAYLEQRIEAGEVGDRSGVVEALKEVGLDVPRAGEHYITAADPETGRRWRLRGSIYERAFDGELARQAPGEDRGEPRGSEGARRRAAEDARRRTLDQRCRREAYHRGRYPAADGGREAVAVPAHAVRHPWPRWASGSRPGRRRGSGRGPRSGRGSTSTSAGGGRRCERSRT